MTGYHPTCQRKKCKTNAFFLKELQKGSNKVCHVSFLHVIENALSPTNTLEMSRRKDDLMRMTEKTMTWKVVP